MSDDNSNEPKTHGMTQYQAVLQAVIDLAQIHKAASRGQVAKVTGLAFAAVDDAIKRLKKDGKIAPIVPGLYEPVPTIPPDRAISITHMPSGMIKLEIADGDALDLTSHEARTLGKLLAGLSQETSSVDNVRLLAEEIGRLKQRAGVA